MRVGVAVARDQGPPLAGMAHGQNAIAQAAVAVIGHGQDSGPMPVGDA